MFMAKQTALYRAIRRIIKNLCVMALVKCSECDCWVEDSSVKCPNCEHPVEKPVSVESVGNNSASEQSGNDAGIYRQTGFPTTDTGYHHERTVRSFAQIMLWLIVVVSTIGYIVAVSVAYKFQYSSYGHGSGVVFSTVFFGLIILGIVIFFAFVMKAFMMVYANISTNIHEINMKLQK